jgi:outer membrane protein assembly factor BamB
MRPTHQVTVLLVFAAALAASAPAQTPSGASGPCRLASWGNLPHRNMAIEAHDLPAELTDANTLWTHEMRMNDLFSHPAVVDGKILVGMSGRLTLPGKDKDSTYEHAQVLCFELETGKLLWRLALGRSAYGVVGTFAIDQDRVYFIDQRRFICADLDGLADGNDGMTDEVRLAKRRKTHAHFDDVEPMALPESFGGDIIWVMNLEDLGVKTHDAGSGTPLVIGDHVWVTTSQDRGIRPATAQMKKPPAKPLKPQPDIRIPNIVVVDKISGKLVAVDEQPIPEVFHGQWSSLSSGMVAGRRVVFWGDGYGVLHAFAGDEFVDRPDGPKHLKQLWRIDANPREYRYDDEGNLIPYPTTMGGDDREHFIRIRHHGPSHLIATPVFHKGRVYAAIGRDRNYTNKEGGRGLGVGAITCVDPAVADDPTKAAIVWRNTDVGRTHTTPSIADGRLYVAGTDGYLYCLDISDGKTIYKHDLELGVFDRSHMLADGKIYVANRRGDMMVFAAEGEKPELLYKTRMVPPPATPMACGNRLILANTRGVTVYVKGAGAGKTVSAPRD